MNLVAEFLAQPSSQARAQWIRGHIDQSEALLWALKEEAARYHHQDPQHALDIAQRAQEVASVLNDPYLVALAHWITANALIFLERHAEAVQHFARATTLLRRNGRTEALGQMAVGYVFALTYVDQYDEALAVAQEARTLLERAGDRQRLALLAMNVGVVYEILERYSEAVRIYEEAIATFHALNDSFNAARALLNIGIVYEYLDRYQDAEAAYLEAEQTFKATYALLEVGRARLNRGILYIRSGRLGEALQAFDQAREDFGRLRVSLQVAEVDLYEAWALLLLNLFPEAERLAARAQAVLEAQQQHRERAVAAYVRGRALLGEGNLDEAEKSLERCLGEFRRLGLDAWIARTRLALAEIAFRRGDYTKALSSVLDVEQALCDSKHSLLRVEALLLAGEICLAKGEVFQASSLFALAREQSESLHHLPSLIRSHHGLGQVAMSNETWDEAWEHLKQAVDTTFRLRDLIPGAPYRAAFLADKLSLLQDAVHTALMRERPKDALNIVVQGQSAAFVDALITPPQEPKQLERWQRLRAEIEALKRAWTWHTRPLSPSVSDDNTETRDAHTQSVLIALETEIDRIRRRLHALSPRKDPMWELMNWQACIPEDVFLLVLIPTAQVVWGIALPAGKEVVVRRLGNTHDVRMLLARWVGHIYHVQGLPAQQVQAHEAFWTGVARNILVGLYHLLLDPFAPLLTSYSRLWIVPDNSLMAIPFTALHTGQTYLIRTHQVSLLPGLAFLRRPPPSHTPDALSLVCGYSAAGRLPHVPYEAATVQSLVPHPVLLLEEEVTLEALRSLIPQAQVVHLATHAIFRDDNPLFSYLQLADGRLTAHELEGLRLRAALVVLSACETGRAGVLGGDLLGLSQAFLAAGARTLIASQWHLYDPFAAAFMETFYRQPYAIADPERSLAQTVRHLLATEPSMHPYFWAPFILLRGGR